MKNEAFKGEVPIAVLCDNSRDAESIPSDLSDFNRYGGLYRHVSLVYVPAISIERVYVEAKLDGEKAAVSVRLRLLNPTKATDEVGLEFDVQDPTGKSFIVHKVSPMSAPWAPNW